MPHPVAIQCPTCEGLIEVEDPAVGGQVECPDCGELYAISRIEPLELVYALDMEEEGEYPDDDRRESRGGG